MTGWIVCTIFLLIITWLLWTPLCLEIDSAAGVFRAEWRGICAVRWLPAEAIDRLYLQVFFIRRTIRLGASRSSPAPIPQKAPARKTARKKPVALGTILRLSRRLLRTFQIKRLIIFWDSDDFIWNARAFPIAFFLSQRLNGQVHINFMGRRELSLLVENRLGRMLWAVLYTFTTKR